MRARILRAPYLPNIRPERWHAALQEHEASIAALVVPDGPRLGRLPRRHKEQAWNELRDVLEHGHLRRLAASP